MQKEGLSTKEANIRLEKYGLNQIQEASRLSSLKIFVRQVKNNFVIYLLIAAVILSFAVGKSVTAYVVLAVILVVIISGFIQEYKAEKAIKSLKSMINPVSIVFRDSKKQEISSNKLVPGDILFLRVGEKIPADCILIEQTDLKVNESILTGESSDVSKIPIKQEKIQKDENMLFMGSFITNGNCIAKVTHTGMNTRFGKIASLISKQEKELPLQDKINKIAKFMIFVALTSAAITGFILFSRAGSFNADFVLEVVILMIAISVAAFPESFPLVLTSTLATGAYRMAQKNAIVNRMSTIETLGETTVICSDKTGTITKGEMTVRKIFADNKLISVSGTGYEGTGEFTLNNKQISLKNNPTLDLLIKSSLLCNDSSIQRTGQDNEYSIIGNPTEAALLILGAKAGIFSEDLKSIRKQEIPFNSERKLMSVLSLYNKSKYIFTKGAPEILLSKCKYIKRDTGVFTLREKDKKQIKKVFNEFTSSSYRVLGVAYKEVKSDLSKQDFEEDLIFLGFVGMEDPPREEVKQSIITCTQAGIKVKMITGDYLQTAVSIAKQIGLNGKSITGPELDNYTDDELSKIVSDITIFARVRPEHKLRIVNALKSNGEVVTMTGDGVNDAPALKSAHVGVAMGKNGTDVSRDVADLTLKDDNFATIVSAIQEGRTIFNNMRKFVTYQISCNYAELMIIIVGIMIGLPLPLLGIQIIFMNMVTSDFPALTLGLNSFSKDLMKNKPKRNEPILRKQPIIMLILAGTIMGLATLIVFKHTLETTGNLDLARTTALLTLIFFELSNAFNFRSFRKPSLTRSLFANVYLVYASIISLIATAIIIYTPLNRFFETVALSINYWLMALAVSLIVVIAFDILKAANNKYKFWPEYALSS